VRPQTLLLAVLVLVRCASGGLDTDADDAPLGCAADTLEAVAPDRPGAPDTIGSDEAAEPACGSCHGNGDDPAPPPGLDGATDPTAPGVGAHAAHLASSTWHADVRCRHCHVVPERVDAPGHVDDARPADVTFGGLATIGVAPSFAPTGCTTGCHGSALHVDARSSPPWTGTLDGCTGCHGLPPMFPHPDATDCGRCHLDVADATGGIATAARHGDGLVQAPHGAHLFHLGGGASTSLACTHCHAGTAYHGPLNDGQTLETTTLCDECHPATFDPLQWRDDPWERLGL